MGKRAGQEIAEGGLQGRETASRIEQKFSETKLLPVKKARAARKIQVDARPVEGRLDVVQQEEVLAVWLRIVALAIQDGLESGALTRDADGNLRRAQNHTRA